MKAVMTALAVPFAFAASQASAQAAPAQGLPVATVLAASDATILRTGTQVAMKTREALTTKGKKLRPGARIQLEVAEAVMINGAVVIPAGSPAVGEVTDIRNKGMWGKSGHINARVLYATVNGRQIRMTGAFDDKGTTGSAGVIASVAFVPLAGFFVTGTSANIPLGAPVTAFLDEDVPVSMAQVASQPLVAVAAVSSPAAPVVEPAAAPKPGLMTIAAPAKK
jgi:hypothetical protein